MPNSKKGFTLIELLIVITIIGILATFVIASFTSAQKKARDGRRKSDLDAIKKALELAKGDTIGGTFYPGCTTAAPCTLDTGGTVLNPNIVANSYIRAIPLDPKGSNYLYAPNTTTVNAAVSYSAYICLENSAEATSVNVSTVAAGTCSSTKQYTITNP